MVDEGKEAKVKKAALGKYLKPGGNLCLRDVQDNRQTPGMKKMPCTLPVSNRPLLFPSALLCH